jgi:hypothetical protein
MPKKTDPLTIEEMTIAADVFMPLFDLVFTRMPKEATVEDCLKVMESVAKLGHKHRADKAEEERKLKFGFNKEKEEDA